MQSPNGGFYCDLCGVAFRRKDNLYAHWRSSCPEIMANIEPGSELFLSDTELKGMVLNLLMRLRRLSRQTPLRPIIANREDGEEVLPHHMETVVFMDDYVNPADTVVDINGELVNVVVPDRNKWCISENGKPLECPDCFRQFANAGRLERHITGFHSHYGAHKCLLCGHRFKYDYNLLFHYRHSCAYTKLLVGADVRKLLDATSLRKLVSHIKQTDPDLRPGSSRLINIKRRPSIKAVPRNVLPLGKGPKTKFKRGLDEGKKCPVCDVVFYGQKSLDKHIGTVHLLSQNFLDKAITRDHTPAVVHSSGIDVAQAQPGEVEYRVAVGTRHGSQIVLEKINKANAAEKTAETPGENVAQHHEGSNSNVSSSLLIHYYTMLTWIDCATSDFSSCRIC
ncbi:unnamed protein product [Cylicostephanus goldi]|uniref:C2H2-type domain-containing protein n=1 Tax=Cylicostephanus goldi TaxID=71465 RepID=A0A3P7MBL4_CYLGO|nr:unnamed protein product [Cylicostephanus goldi]